MKKKVNVVIMGATGAVGTDMLKLLKERDFPVGQLKLIADPKEAGQKINFLGTDYVVEPPSPDCFKGSQITLMAVDVPVSLQYSPEAVKCGSIVVDNSSAYRLDPKVPLVVPEVNEEDIWTHQGIIANPNCATIIPMVALGPLHKYANIRRLVASTYQSAAGGGFAGIKELKDQCLQVINGEPVTKNVFLQQIAFNVFPHIDKFQDNDYTYEEMKMVNESRKILHCPELRVNCTSVRVPTISSIFESITIETERELTPQKAREILANAPGIKLTDDPANSIYPMPVDVYNQGLIFVGRIRRDISADNSLSLCVCGDQVRKGAALNAVQIAEILASRL